MRRDKLANVERVVSALESPGTEAEVERRTGMSQTTTNRAIATAIALGKVYQSGWTKASRFVPLYSRCPIPEGFELPPMPQGMTDAERRTKYKRENREKVRIANREYERRKQADKVAERERRREISAAVFGIAYTYRRKES
jgi:hypothetical protein